jgi:DNA segregation ATPase FtsK/SpoIIIE, S-DNA-T family
MRNEPLNKKKTFTIPKINEPQKKDHTFVSPFFGSKNKDDIVIPQNELQKGVNKRYDDFRKEKKFEEDKKERYKREFNIVNPDDIYQEKKNTPSQGEGYTKLEQKPGAPAEKLSDELSIPFGLEDDVEPLSDADLNEVLGDYEPVELDPLDAPEPTPQKTTTPLQQATPEASPDEDWMLDNEEEVEDIPTPTPARPTPEPKQQEMFDRNEPVKPRATMSYQHPPLSLLERKERIQTASQEDIEQQREIIDMTLANFKIGGKVIDYTHGPTVTLFEIRLDQGVMVNRISSIASNLKMNLAAVDIRIEAPIPGKQTVGIEVPNPVREIVNFGNLIDDHFVKNSKPLDVILGVDLGNETIIADINKMPHGLIAGATGSGKSVCIDTVLMSLLLKSHPEELKLILIDPKRVGLAAYAKVPHLATPIIHDAKIAAEVLRWAVDEMERRYDKMYLLGVRDVTSYNEKIQGREDEGYEHIPTLVVIIEEMADLMAQAGADVEVSVARIAQKARAANIHLLIATQRPSVDVIKGTIKSNIPTRIAMKVSSYTDSMVILDYQGAESLLGNGDMLFVYSGSRVKRLQGAYVSESEIDAVTDYLSQYPQHYLLNQDAMSDQLERAKHMGEQDELFLDVAEYVIEMDYASINKIQQQFNIGYNRAANIFEQLTDAGIVSPQNSKTPRKVLITMEQFIEMYRS